LIFSKEYGHYFSIFLSLGASISYLFVSHPNGIPKNANKNSSMKRKYMTKQGGNNDEEGTAESKQKPSE